MSMPLSSHSGKLGPIEVSEDATHFLVRIHPENRDRAKRIPGRQWDGERKAWVYAKDPSTYDALVAEFQKDADSFTARRPKTKRPPGIKPPLDESDEDEFENQLLEEIRSLGSIGESRIYGELDQMRAMLESFRDIAVKQDRALEEVRGTQADINQTLLKLESTTQQSVNIEPMEVLPESLDLTKQTEIEIVEKALVKVACLAAGEKPSFLAWVSKYYPLSRPTDFVNDSHELVREQLGKIASDENSRTSFSDLVQKIQKEKLLFNASDDPTQIVPTLRNLNRIRNRFAHPRGEFSQGERWSRSLLYLMELALVWSKLEM